MRLVLLGPPGAGKGTQAQYLTEILRIPKISTGEMLRDAAEKGTTVGLEGKRYTDQGLLVPDDVIVRMVIERLQQPNAAHGYLLDGFPRTVAQAQSFDAWLRDHGQAVTAAIDIQVRNDEIVERISCRRVCPSCHETYHLLSRPPKVDEICDACGHKLAQRDDDRAELVRERLRVYHERTEPVLAYYRAQNLLIPIHGERPVAEVTQAIIQALGRQENGQR
jgi:adenylate kinase